VSEFEREALIMNRPWPTREGGGRGCTAGLAVNGCYLRYCRRVSKLRTVIGIFKMFFENKLVIIYKRPWAFL